MDVESIISELQKESEAIIRRVLEQEAAGFPKRLRPTWKSRTGRTLASLTPGNANNVLQIVQDATGFTMIYGSALPHFRYLEERSPVLETTLEAAMGSILETTMDELLSATQKNLQ